MYRPRLNGTERDLQLKLEVYEEQLAIRCQLYVSLVVSVHLALDEAKIVAANSPSLPHFLLPPHPDLD